LFPNSRTTIIALTASALEKESTAILTADYDDLMQKPLKKCVIFEKIADI
jgi:CheY-like chemotaxis protein